MQDSFFHAAAPTPPPILPTPSNGFPDLHFDHPPMFDMSTPPYLRELPRPRLEPASVTNSLSLFEDANTPPSAPASRPGFSGQSPRLIDLLLPGSELNTRPGAVTTPPISIPTPAMSMSPMMDHQFLSSMEMTQETQLEEDIEEIIREPQMSDAEMWMALRGPAHASRSSSGSPATTRDD